MKTKLLLFSLLVAFGMVFSGCDKVKSLADINLNVDLPASFNVNLNPVGGIESTHGSSLTFDQSMSIDPTSNSDVQKYISKIKSWQVNGVTGTFNNVNASITLDTLKLQVYSNSQNATWLFTNVTVNNGNSLTLDDAKGQWTAVNSILANKSTFTVSISGSTNSTTGGTQFTLDVVIKTKLTVNPL